MTTMELKSPISGSVNSSELNLSAKSNMESMRNLALEPLWIESFFSTCPLRQIIELFWVSNMQASRTRRTSNTPALRSVTWSSCGSREKPGILLANSTTPLIAGENLLEKSWRSSCWPVNG